MHANLPVSQQEVLENYLSVLFEGDLLSSVAVLTHDVETSDAALVAAEEPVTVASNEIHLMPFDVVGLALALEKAAVAAVLPWPAQGLVAAKADDADEILGTLNIGGRTTWVLDTAKLVVPTDHPGRPNLLARRRYRTLVLLNDAPVALACDAVDETIIVDEAAVQWRTNANQYGWMKASVPAVGVALLDPKVAAQFRPTT